MRRKYLWCLGDYHKLKARGDCSLGGTRAVRLAPGCTESNVVVFHVLQALPTHSWIPDLAYGLQEAAQLHEHCWGTHHNCPEAS